MKDTIVSLLAALFIILLNAVFCFWAWNGFALEFNLPTFNYWHWVVTLMAVRALISPVTTKRD